MSRPDDRRLYVPHPDNWTVRVKPSFDREYCHAKFPGEPHYHLLMVIFFENTELKKLTDSKVYTTEDIYIKTIAGKYRYEKQLIARELRRHGIISVLTTPDKLSINSMNKYLELKNRQSI